MALGKRAGLVGVLIAVTTIVAVGLIIWRPEISIDPPPPPQGVVKALEPPATTSYIHVAATLPSSAIGKMLDDAIPKSFQFDVNNGARAYGTPSRGAIAVSTDIGEKRVKASTPVSGRVQVEKTVIVRASVGIDIAGEISASVAPVAAKDWSIQPNLDVSANVNRAVAKTAVGDIDVTGLVRKPISEKTAGIKGDLEKKLADALKFRGDAERLWNQINAVYQVATEPPTWLRITPREAIFPNFEYAANSVNTGLAVTVDARVFIQKERPELVNSPLPDLKIMARPSDQLVLSLPADISYETINQQLSTRLPKNIELPGGAWMKINTVTLAAYGDGVLLTVGFNGKKGWPASVAGRLHVVGVPIFDPEKAELRVEKLEYTVDTKNMLLKGADWLMHDDILDSLRAAAVVNLTSEITKAKSKVNAQLDELKGKLPQEITVAVSVSELAVERLAFVADRAFVLVTAKGKMSAQLRK